MNFAAVLLGKVAVNLNYTYLKAALEVLHLQCLIKTVVSRKAFSKR